MKARVERIEKDDPDFGEKARDEFAEGGAESIVRGVRLAKGLADGIRIRAFERGGGFADKRLNLWAEDDFAHAAAFFFCGSARV